MQGGFEGHIGGSVDYVGKEFTGEWAASVSLSKNINSLLDPNDASLSEEIRDLVTGAVIFPKAIQQSLVIKFLAGDPSSQFFYHFFPTIVDCRKDIA